MVVPSIFDHKFRTQLLRSPSLLHEQAAGPCIGMQLAGTWILHRQTTCMKDNWINTWIRRHLYIRREKAGFVPASMHGSMHGSEVGHQFLYEILTKYSLDTSFHMK